jgi:prenyltransferase beta subunit
MPDGSNSLQIFRAAASACAQLDDAARGEIVTFLDRQKTASGLFPDRRGQPDIYYSFFATAALVALNRKPDVSALQSALREIDESRLDLIHLGCLLRLRIWCRFLSLVSMKRLYKVLFSHSAIYQAAGQAMKMVQPSTAETRGLAESLLAYRTADGGFAMKKGAAASNPYAGFLVWQAFEDAGLKLPQPDALLQSLETCRSADGGYGSAPGLQQGTTPVTAAAALLKARLGKFADPELVRWLQDQRHPKGGYLAGPQAPVPDLLSTGVTLFTLRRLGGDPVTAFSPEDRAATEDFITLHWNDDGGFCGTLADPQSDCEYTFYGLLALGCLQN